MAYPAAALLLAVASPVGRDHTGLTVALTGLVLVVAALRALLLWRGDPLYARDPRRWRLAFAAGVLVVGGAWSCLSATLVLLYGLSEFGFVGLVCAGAIASTGVVVYRSHLGLMRAQGLVILVPNLVACVVEGSTSALALAAAIAGIYLPYLWVEGHRSYEEYRAGLEARIEAAAKAELLRESEESYRDLVDRARVAIAVDDRHGRLVYFNPRFAELLGCPPDESSDRTFERLIDPGDLDQFRAARAALYEAGTGPTRLELRGVRWDGRTVVVELAGEPLTTNNQVVGARWYLWDVTARAEAEQERTRLLAELEHRRAEFEAIVERSREGMVVVGAAGRVAYANPAARQLLPELDRALDGVAQLGPAPSGEYREVTTTGADGREGVAELRLQPTDWRGEPASLVLLRDVTERHEAERALKASEQRFRDLFERNLAGVYRSTLAGRLLDCNEAFARIYGFASREEALANPAVELYQDPADREQFLAALRSSGRLTAFGSTGRRRDGSPVYLLENVVLLPDESGRPGVIQGTVLDVTASRQTTEALRRSEERMAVILRSLPVAVYTAEVPSELDASWISDSFERITGYGPRRMVEEPGFWSARLHPDDREQVARQLLELGQRRRSELAMEYRWQVADGSHRWFYEHCVVSTAPPEGPVQVVGTFVDVTERRQLESQLAQAQKMEAVGRLAGGIAHDFNNLLQTMLAEIAAARRTAGDDNAPLQATVDRLEDQVRRSAALTRQLLLFSRRQEAERRVFDLNTVVAENGRMLRGWTRPDIRLEVACAAEPLWLSGSAVELGQVVLNLALNACDAMPSGGRLLIRTARVEGRIVLEVRDTGSGIAEDIREKIFEPFFSTKDKERGTGLGLAVVHGIVASHGGEVAVESEVGVGTTFRVLLPAATEAPTEAPQERRRAAGAGGSERILLVEDHESLRETLAQLLTASGYQVLTAASAEEARALADAHVFDLLLSDVMLPGATGAELVTGLRQRRPDLPVILMSGYAEARVLRPVLEVGDLRFLEKPVSVERLDDEIRAALAARRKAQSPQPDGPAAILVVDDEETLRQTLVAILQAGGHQVRGVARAEEALELAGRPGERFDLVVTDLNLPAMGGGELLRRLRALPDPPAVLVCSGGSPPPTLDAHGDEVDFLPKPFDLDDLERRVVALVARRRGRS